MIVSGEPVRNELFAQIPSQKLFHHICASIKLLAEVTLSFVCSISGIRPLLLVRDLPCRHLNGDAYFQFAYNMVKGPARNVLALLQCVDAVEAVEAAIQKRFEEDLVFKREIGISRIGTPQSRALRHTFTAERAASETLKVPAPALFAKTMNPRSKKASSSRTTTNCAWRCCPLRQGQNFQLTRPGQATRPLNNPLTRPVCQPALLIGRKR